MIITKFQVSYTDTEERPAFYLNDVKNADFLHVKAQRTEGVSEFVLKNVENIRTHYTQSIPDTTLPKSENATL